MQIKNRKSDFFFGLNNISLVCQVNVFCERAIFWKKQVNLYTVDQVFIFEKCYEKNEKVFICIVGVILVWSDGFFNFCTGFRT